MQIEFNIQNYKYYIKDLGIGFGAFVRLERQLELRDNHLLNMGESFIIVNLINEKPHLNGKEKNYSLSTYDSRND